MLRDRVAIVTGAGEGIGRAIVVELAKAGAHVVASGRRLEPLEAVADETRALGRRSLPLSGDVRHAGQRNHRQRGCRPRQLLITGEALYVSGGPRVSNREDQTWQTPTWARDFSFALR